jgi:pectin methylesterase-like acyl-CoA thioesterase
MRLRVGVLGVWLAALALGVSAQERIRLPLPPPTFTVGGYQSDYGSIQDAVSAAPEDGAIIRIRPGVYREPVKVVRPGIQLRGDGKDPQKVLLIFASPSPTLTVTGDAFYAEGLTIANDSAEASAGALSITGDRAVLRNVRVLGGLTSESKSCTFDCHPSREYFESCHLEGGFLSGDAKVVFNGCDLRNVWGMAGFVFEHCRFEGAGRVSPGGVLLHSEVAGTVQATGTFVFGRSDEGRGLTSEEARKYAADTFLRGTDSWAPQKIR